MTSYQFWTEQAKRSQASVNFGSVMTAWTPEMLAWWTPERTTVEMSEFMEKQRTSGEGQ